MRFRRVREYWGHRPFKLDHSYCFGISICVCSEDSDIKTIQANLGHATAQFTLDVYGHVTQKMRQDSASRMQKFYEHLNTKNGQ